MNIRDGNIFEVMRIILPEMRTEIKRAQKEETKQEQPNLTEDAIEEIQYVISEALLSGLRLRLTLFDPYGNVEWEGTPIPSTDGKLWLRNEYDTTKCVPLDKLIKAEIAN